MITTLLVTENDEQSVGRIITSIINQKYTEPYEIVVVDNASRDKTIQNIKRNFPDIKIIRLQQKSSWTLCLSTGAKRAKGNIVAVFDIHCTYEKDWLDKIREGMQSSYVMTGSCKHGMGFMKNLVSIGFHASFLKKKPGRLSGIFDDNFVIKKKLLLTLLSKINLDVPFDDGAGATVLSWFLGKEGYRVIYQPKLVAHHITPTFREYVGLWYTQVARNTIMVNQYNRAITGGNDLTRLFDKLMSAVMWYKEDILNLLRHKRGLQIAAWKLPFFAGCLGITKIAYLLGLLKD